MHRIRSIVITVTVLLDILLFCEGVFGGNFSDDFSTDTIWEYTVTHTWTGGGIGQFIYDSVGRRAQVLTGNDVGLMFSHDVPALNNGSFSIDFLPTEKYPSGGILIIRLVEDQNNYFELINTDGYGPKQIKKVVNGATVASVFFQSEYTQNNNYHIIITFSPDSTTVEAFGDVLTLSGNSDSISVSSFEVQLRQQDAYYDNIEYRDNNPVNQPPNAADDSVSVEKNNSVDIDILANDSDSDGTIDPFTVSIVIGVSHGTTAVNGDGTVTYTPEADCVGDDSFTYTVQDYEGALSNEATVSISVQEPNDPPSAVDDSASTDEDVPVNIDVLANDSDSDGLDPTTVSVVTGASHGTTVVNGDGSITYSPSPDYSGNDSFTYTVDDNRGATSNEATVSVTINSINDSPVASDDSASTDEDVPVNIDVLANDSDIDGILETVSVVTGASHGTTVVNGDGSITYTPGSGFTGVDSFTYVVSDNEGAPSNEAQVAITVSDNTFLFSDDFSTDTIWEYTVTHTWTGGGIGQFIYDSVGRRAQVLTGNDVGLMFSHDVPALNNGSFSIDFLPTEKYPSGGILIIRLVEDQNNYFELINTDGYGPKQIKKVVNGATVASVFFQSEYTQNNNYHIIITFSPDSTTVEAFGDVLTLSGNSDSISVSSFEVQLRQQDAYYDNIEYRDNNPVNQPPNAADDSVSVEKNNSVDIDILANDSDSDGTIDPFTVSIVIGVSHGTTAVNGDGTVTYTPEADCVGDDSFTYTVQDYEGALSNEATVSISVQEPNDPPSAVDDSASTDEDVPVNIDVLANDSDSDGLDPTTVSVVTGASHGTTVVNGDGSITYSPSPDYSGNDSFTYTVDDNRGATSNEATVSVTINSINDSPVASDDSASTDEDVPVNIDVLANDSDIDGILETVSVVTGASHGTTVVNGDGSITYTPGSGFTGVDSFTYVVSDNEGAPSNEAQVAITVSDNTFLFSDDFSTDTIWEYTVTHTWTDGGIGQFVYDSVGRRAQVLTGNDVGLIFSHDVPALNNGSFSIDFLPTEKYPSGGILIIRLVEDQNNYFELINTDGYGPKQIKKVVNGATVASVFFQSEYTQNNNYHIIITFSPDSTTVEAFGDVLTLSGNSDSISVSTFEVQLRQQDAYYDNIFYADSGVNVPPVANDDSATTDEDTAVTIDVVANDTDTDGTVDPTSVAISILPSHGTADNNLDGTITYTPDTGFTGPDTFTYTVNDDDNDTSNEANVTVTVAANVPPVANDDSTTTDEDTAVTVDVVANDTDTDGTVDPTSVAISILPSHGTADNNLDGTITYTPDTGFTGPDTFTYTVNDDDGATSNEATVLINVIGNPLFSDDFSSDTTGDYTITHTLTDGGLGSFIYDGSGQRAQVLTGDDVGLQFSHDVPSRVKGIFSVDFLSIQKYPNGGIMKFRLVQDQDNYYEIKNTDGYGALEVKKVVNGVTVDSYSFTAEYAQNNNYHIEFYFTPAGSVINAFGETAILDSNGESILVSSFEIEARQQDAYFDNIEFTDELFTKIYQPDNYYLTEGNDFTVKAISNADASHHQSLRFVVDVDTPDEYFIDDISAPFEVEFPGLVTAEHTVDVYIVDGSGLEVQGPKTHDQRHHVATGGDYHVGMGDSITYGYADDDPSDDTSNDGRNTGGGYIPVLNDFLTTDLAKPHYIANEGVPGAQSVDGRNTVQDILNRHPQSERFLILYGTNDAGALPAVPSGVTLNPGNGGYDGSFKDNMQQIINAINGSSKEACIAKVPVQLADCSTCPWYENPSEGARNEIVRGYNRVIDELFNDIGNQISVVPPDFYTYYLNHYEQEYADWLHPDGLGYRSMADLWRWELTR